MSVWKDVQLLGRLGVVLTIPVVLAVGPLVGYLIGSAVDQRWRTGPWGLGIGLTLGGTGSCIEVYRILRWVASLERKRIGKS